MSGAVWIFTRSRGRLDPRRTKARRHRAVPDSGKAGPSRYPQTAIPPSRAGPEDPLFLGIGGGVDFARSGGIWTQQSDKLIGAGYYNHRSTSVVRRSVR